MVRTLLVVGLTLLAIGAFFYVGMQLGMDGEPQGVFSSVIILGSVVTAAALTGKLISKF